MKSTYKHYGWPVSYYSGKTRAYLSYKGIPFQDISPSLRQMQGELKKRVGFTVMPVIVTPDNETLQDTSEIIDWFEARYPDRSVYPETPMQRMLALLFELYGDEWLLLPAMHYRWNFPEANDDFLRREMGAAGFPAMPGFIQKKLAGQITKRLSGYVKSLGITEQTIPAIESWTETLCDQLDQHFAEHDYLFGGRPSIGDYGLIGPFWAHLGRDPWPRDNLIKPRKHLAAWVARMVNPPQSFGDWIGDDAVPELLFGVLQRFVGDFWPLLKALDGKIVAWSLDNPGKPLPRGLGKAKFTLDGVSEQRFLMPFMQWMAQRPLSEYKALSAEVKADIDQRLHGEGLYEAFQLQFATSLERKNRRLFVA